MSDIIDAEVVEEPNTGLVPVTGGVGLYHTDNPNEIINQASAQAAALDKVVRAQGFFVRIGQGEHLRVEGWQTLGALVGVFPVTQWTKEIRDDDGRVIGFRARVEAMRDGNVVGAAESRCLRSERNWRDRDEFALESMAQTRATAKALSQPLRFIVSLAGYAGTPAEEMPSEPDRGWEQREKVPRPSRDQVRARNNTPSEPPVKGDGPSEKQKKMAYAVSRTVGLDTSEDRHAFMAAVVGREVKSIDELTGPQKGSEITRLLDALKAVESGEATLGFNDAGPYPVYGGAEVPEDEKPF